MCRFLPAVLLIVAIPTALRGQDAQKELDKFQGTWRMLAWVSSGKDLKVVPDKMTVTFKADKMTMEIDLPGRPKLKVEWTLKLDPSKNPKTLDATIVRGKVKGDVFRGIYKFENNELRICLPKVPMKDRPSEFKAPDDSQLTLLYLEKRKK
jgi:uncharacterized protein (TIGR03067 family)